MEKISYICETIVKYQYSYYGNAYEHKQKHYILYTTNSVHFVREVAGHTKDMEE